MMILTNVKCSIFRSVVNDKRQRVETDDQKQVCDEEYLLLGDQCTNIDLEIVHLTGVTDTSRMHQGDVRNDKTTL